MNDQKTISISGFSNVDKETQQKIKDFIVSNGVTILENPETEILNFQDLYYNGWNYPLINTENVVYFFGTELNFLIGEGITPNSVAIKIIVRAEDGEDLSLLEQNEIEKINSALKYLSSFISKHSVDLISFKDLISILLGLCPPYAVLEHFENESIKIKFIENQKSFFDNFPASIYEYEKNFDINSLIAK
jgi:hypothetical protein